MDVVVIGGGPAGLFAAITAASNGKKVVLLEKNPKCGKKFLITGKGQCNLTNSISIDRFKNHIYNSNFLKFAFKSFTNNDLMEFFKKRGAKFEFENNKVFPCSRSAGQLLRILLEEIKILNVQVDFNSEVKDIQIIENKIKIISTKKEYLCSNVIVCTGGASYSVTGSDGKMFSILKKIGIDIIKPEPGLTPLIPRKYLFHNCSGISINDVLLTHWRDSKKLHSLKGDILFTHNSLSGPAILAISGRVKKNDIIKVNIIKKSFEEFREDFNIFRKKNTKSNINSFLKEYSIPVRLYNEILNEINIDKKDKINEMSKNNINILLKSLTEYEFVIENKKGFEKAMITSGGIDINTINKKNMRSKQIKNISFAGEIMDVDGETGGFNLQIAFSTGYLAGNNV